MRYVRRYFTPLATAMLLSVVLVACFYSNFIQASTTPATVRPINTGVVTGWTGAGTPGGSCSGLCDYIDEAATDGDTSYLNGPAGSSPSANFGIGGSTVSGQTVTSVVVHVVGRSGAGSILGYPPVTVSLTVGASTVSAPTITFNSTTYQDLTATFTGTWTKTAFDTASVTIVKGANGLQPAVRISTVYAAVTWRAPDITQNTSRVYQNANTTAPGSPLGAANTLTDVAQNSQFRVRLGFGVSDYDWQTGLWGTHANLYKLQYAARGAGSCAAPTGAWSDVLAGSGPIRWYDNSSVVDGAVISSAPNDPPLGSGTATYQVYRESNSFGLSSATAIENTAIWDFSLQNVSATPGTVYCMRVIKNDSTTLTAYTAYPQIVITGDYGVDIVDNAGTSVIAPFVSFPTGVVATTQCNLPTAMLGIPSQKLRINNDLKTNGWNVTIAATAGPTASWTAGTSHYDYNDASGTLPGCGDGGDADAYAGQLRINPTSATLTPKTGCTASGLSLGPDTKFSEGAIDAITIASANASAARFCYWDVTNVALEQRIPPRTPAGAYGLDMTITMTAL